MNNQELIIKKLFQTVKEDEYIQMLGLELIDLKPGYAKSRIKFSKKLCNPYNVIHGGCLYSIADITAGYAGCAYGHFVTTISGNMNYVRPAKNSEYIYCEAKVVRQGNKVCAYNVELFDDNNEILQNGSFNFYVMSNTIL